MRDPFTAEPARGCSRPGCKRPPVHTLTYDYRDSTVVLGPLSTYVEPHCYDLCAGHAGRLTVPRGWDVVRLPPTPGPEPEQPEPPDGDIEALADAVREAASMRSPGQVPEAAEPVGQGVAAEPVGQGVEVSRRGHLRVVRSTPSMPGR